MKKKGITILIVIVILAVLAGVALLIHSEVYNKAIIDLTYAYDTAIIKLPNGEVVQGKVESWTDYKDGDQLQIKVNGKVYLVHSANVVLIKE